MIIVKINTKNPEKEKIKMVLDILRQGGTVVYPTDTVYGLAANIFKKKAVLDVYEMKKRSLDKPLSICLSEPEDIMNVAYLDSKGEEIVQEILPGPYTLILKRKENVPPQITGKTDKIGVRIPNNVISREISSEFPITATSANISGHPSPRSVSDVQKDLDGQPDIIIDSGPCKSGFSSTVVDITVNPPNILRKGAGMEKLISIIK